MVRVVRLALESSGEGVETLERSVAEAASAYGVDVELVLLPEQIILTDRASGEVARVAVVRATPGIFRLDRVAALKRVLNRMEPSLDVAKGLPHARRDRGDAAPVAGVGARGGGRALGLLPLVGAFVVTTLGVTVLRDLSDQTGVTLVALPALFIVVPGDTLSSAASSCSEAGSRRERSG